MNLLLIKLASRKLVIALGTVTTLLTQRQYVPAAVVAATYIAGQAHIDAKTEVIVAREVARIATAVADHAAANPSLTPGGPVGVRIG